MRATALTAIVYQADIKSREGLVVSSERRVAAGIGRPQVTFSD